MENLHSRENRVSSHLTDRILSFNSVFLDTENIRKSFSCRITIRVSLFGIPNTQLRLWNIYLSNKPRFNCLFSILLYSAKIK
jgi:hypothetical protein